MPGAGNRLSWSMIELKYKSAEGAKGRLDMNSENKEKRKGKGIFSFLRCYWEDRNGTIAILFGITFPLLLSAVGLAIDFAQAYLVKERLSHALDAAALAAAASGAEGDAAVQAEVQKFLDANYPEYKIGTQYDLDVTISGDDIHVTAWAYYETTFLRIVQIDTINVSEDATVHREVQGLEVVLVLDNTGSMNYTPYGSGKSNIEALREAAMLFVDVLTNKGKSMEGVKVGVVPFSNSVRVGRYGLGYKYDGTAYDGDPFVTLPAGNSFTTTIGSSRWFGCVVEHNPHGWDANIDTNDPYPQDVSDDYEGPWDIYQNGSYVCTQSQTNCVKWNKWGNCTQTQTVCLQEGWQVSSPNNGCPYANLLPLSQDYGDIMSILDDMNAGGNTLSNVGTEWGYKVLSPEPPFTEGAEWNSEYWKKAIVIMTDGVNTKNGNYSYYWRSDDNQLDVDDFDSRLQEICTDLKDTRDVTVYTITFDSGGDFPEAVFRQCATSPEHYFHAPTQDELQNVFRTIARQLANLHISG